VAYSKGTVQGKRDRRSGENPTQKGPPVGRPLAVTEMKGQTAILPPPCLVMASKDGRTGMSSLKSGQRVDGSS
jgi:hypothetical protein